MPQSGKPTMQLMDIKETAHVLEISPATVRNWIKHHYIMPVTTDGKMHFFPKDVHTLKENICSGKVNRLRKRANKNTSPSTFLPLEYLDNPQEVTSIEHILKIMNSHNVKTEEGLFFLSLKMLMDEGMIKKKARLNTVIQCKDEIFTHKHIQREIKEWARDITPQADKAFLKELMDVHTPRTGDLLGFLYQALAKEGNKTKAGAYYTPSHIVKEIVDEYINKPRLTVLDPCCGTGQFLLRAVNRLLALGNTKALTYVWGCDSDPLAVRLARINLLIACKKADDISPNIYCINSLLQGGDIFLNDQTRLHKNAFDLIVTNPPWGAKITKHEKDQLATMWCRITSGESFSYFLAKGMDVLKKGGILSYILPEAFLHVKAHKDMRAYLAKNFTIRKIVFLGRVFKNVFTSVVRVDVQKTLPLKKHGIHVHNGKTFTIQQSYVLKNNNQEISISIDTEDARILKKIFNKKYTTLTHDKAEWALGIVTGSNDAFLSPKRRKGCEGVLKGKDIMKFFCKPAQWFLAFDPEQFQQVAPEYKYRAQEKLIYRFISKQLIFAYDDKQQLTLNSANILIPQTDTHPIKVILGLFNSSLYQFIFQKKYNSIKVLRSHIESLPLPAWTDDVYNRITHFVDHLIEPTIDADDRARLFDELDFYIMQKWGLTKKEIEYVQKNARMS